MKNQNLIVSRERLDDLEYMVFISIHSLCRLKHELKGISNCPLSIVFVFDFVIGSSARHGHKIQQRYGRS